MQQLKEKLLNLGIVEDNEYLDKYCQLIIDNKNRIREKYKCQRHHIIPRCYYKYNGFDINNSKDNIVILLHKDHVLARYYLSLCSKNNWFKLANAYSFRHTLNYYNYKDKLNYIEERELIEKLDCYQELQELCNTATSQRMQGVSHLQTKETKLKISNTLKGRKVSLEARTKISEGNKGRKAHNKGKQCYTNGIINIFLSQDDEIPDNFILGNCLQNKPRYKMRGIKRTEEEKKQISAKLKGYRVMTNGSIVKHIYPNDVQKYLDEGWRFGKK